MDWTDKQRLSRAEIIEAYDGKIEAGARSKLSKGNKMGLIHWFIKRLNDFYQNRYADAVNQGCFFKVDNQLCISFLNEASRFFRELLPKCVIQVSRCFNDSVFLLSANVYVEFV